MTHSELMSLGIGDLIDLYVETFGTYFNMWWEDDPENHRKEIVRHIETGIPQKKPFTVPYKLEKGAIY